jgi:hypothetical protein
MPTDFESIKTAAMALINDPSRKFGRAGFHTLSDLVGLALVQATESARLASDEFERARREILKSFREGRAC